MALRPWNVLSLCTGYGGIELALRLAVPRARTVCMVEREAFLCGHLEEAMEQALMAQAPLHSDVKTFDGRPWRGKVDCIVGGYPCQPFSIAGRRLGAADPRHLWPAIRRIVDEVCPPYCFFENVDDHLRLGFDQVIQDLEAMDYVVEAGIFSSSETGAGHVRERLYIMAFSAERERDAGSKEPGTAGAVRGDGAERDHTDGSGGVLDAAEKLGHSQKQGLPLGDPKGQRRGEAERGQAGRAGPNAPSAEVGNSDGSGRHWHPEESLFAGRLCPEPPGRNDDAGWRRALELHPELAPKLPMEVEPGLSGMADEIAHRMVNRVDRVRAIGNGVDPVVAAVAFSTLHFRLRGGQ